MGLLNIVLRYGGRHRFTQEEISSPLGFVIILGGIIAILFLLRWMIFGKDAKKKFLGIFPARRIDNPDLQYLVSIIVFISMLILLIFLLVSSISGLGLA